MRSLAYVETIKALKPIINADSIECAEILGWEVVVKKGDFRVGDRVIYVETDAILPELPAFEFMRPRKFRVKIAKLRGQISMGIAFPLSIAKEVDPTVDVARLRVGDDMMQMMQITKYDPESALDIDTEPQEKKSWIANKWSFVKWKLFGFKKVKSHGDFPTHLVPKTDETRVQNMGRQLSEREGQPVYITEKLEGSSATFIYLQSGNWLAKKLGKDGIFQVCSRNRMVYNSQKGGAAVHYLCTIADKYDLRNRMKKLDRNIAVQAESLGPKIQGNPYKFPEHDMRVFLIYDIDKQAYVPYDELVSLCKQMDLPMVPVLSVAARITNDIKYWVELSKGKSMLLMSADREGIVMRTMDGTFSFKSINPDYLLKQD